MRKHLLTTTIAVLLTAGPAFAQSIVIGVSTPVTGVAASASEWERWGVDLALEEINAAGGLLGRKVEAMVLDNKCNPSEAVNVTNKLVEAKVVAIIGSHCSSAHLAAMPIIKDAKIPMITGIASNPQITALSGVGGNEWAFRINPSDTAMMDALGSYLEKKKIFKTVAMVAEDTDYGRGAVDAFKAATAGAGITIVSTDFHPQNTPDFTTILTRIQQRRPDAIGTVQLSGDSINFLRNAMQLGLHIPYTGRIELGGRNVQIIEAGGMEGSINAWTYSQELDSPQNKAFVGQIKAKHNSTPYLQTWGSYDSIRVLAQAIKEAGSTDATQIRDALKKLKFTPVHGREVAFDDHNQAGKFVVLQTVKDRKVTVADIVEVK
jgi:branched-chain amino acid transport system substrate-binding protein